MATLALTPGSLYSRRDLFRMLGLHPDTKGGPFHTGYASHHDEHFIFCHVGTAGRTGHDYPNKWLAPGRIRWFGKTRSKAHQPKIRAMTNGFEPVYFFWRENDRDAFIFAGLAIAENIDPKSSPVEIVWKIDASIDLPLAEELPDGAKYTEGAVKRITVNAYERNPDARQKCISHYGATCTVCDFDFGATYGNVGTGFIHVHHLVPVAGIGRQYHVDPIKDLRPVCANCHAMIHLGGITRTLEELRMLVDRCRS